jgi:hypothetical protein
VGLVTRRRLRGCGLQVQEAAEQHVVMKTITRSNIRGSTAPNVYSEEQSIAIRAFLICEALCLFIRDVPALSPQDHLVYLCTYFIISRRRQTASSVAKIDPAGGTQVSPKGQA